MSPLSLRRYRAERILREDFERLRAGVGVIVRGRLRASGVHLDASDLDACYAQALVFVVDNSARCACSDGMTW